MIGTACMNGLLTRCKLSLISHNIRSINKNFDALKMSINQYTNRVDIINIQEAWKIDVTINYKIHGYAKPYINGRKSGNGGGVVTWINDKLDHALIDKLSIFIENEYESIAMEVNLGPVKYIIINCYRPPKGNFLNFIHTFKGQLELAFGISNNVIIMGDMNIDLMHNSWQTIKYLDLISKFGLEQQIKLATRRATSNTLIDHII
jgi:exonuclease III